MDIELFFSRNPVFRHSEFAKWKNQSRVLKRISINTSLQYYLKSGRIISILRGLYAVVPVGMSKESVIIDPYLISARSSSDSILGYHTALELHGLSYSAFSEYTYLTQSKNKLFQFQGQFFHPTRPPKPLITKNMTDIYTQTVNRQGMNIKLTNLARTYVDILDRVEVSGGWEEVCRAIFNVLAVNIDEIVEYCLLLENSRLASKVGYFLEQRTDAFKVSDSQISRLLDAKPQTPQYASKKNRDNFELIKKWNLLLPKQVIYQTWEEPNADI